MSENWRTIWERFLVPLDDPGSRLFHMNILMAVAFLLAWIWWVRRAEALPRESFWQTFRRLVFRRRYWWNDSTKVDYQVYVLNGLLRIFLLIPFLDFSFEISRFTARWLVRWSGDFAGWEARTPALLGFTALAFVWDDLLRFGQHWLMHRVPFLWRIHSVHHSARVLTPITLFRNHPLESAIATLRNSISLGVMTGLFIFLFEARFTVLTLFGVNAFGFLFNFLGSNLRHSHIPVGFGRWVETVFISPKQHQIHHSTDPLHFNKNLGVSLAVWDRLNGSLIYSRELKSRTLRFGLSGTRRRQSLWRELFLRN